MRWFLPALAVLCLTTVGCRSIQDRADPVDSDLTVEPLAPAEPPPATVELSDLSTLAPGDYTFTLRHDWRSRSYIVHVPPRPTIPAPIIMALHGGGGTGAQFQEENGLDAVADREGFVVIYPEGTGILPNRLHTWNSGETCCGFAFDRQIDDVGFLRAVLSDIHQRTPIDDGRVYLTGHSNGAMMAYRFAVEASDLVTAVVAVGGAADLSNPVPSRPIPLLHIHSADDPRALYEGGEGPPFPGTNRTVHHEPVLPMIQTWASANGCSSSSLLTESMTGSGDNDGHSLERFMWPECAASAPVEHLVLHGSGHGWPGVTAPAAVQRHLGPATTLLNASEEVWAFASQFEQ